MKHQFVICLAAAALAAGAAVAQAQPAPEAAPAQPKPGARVFKLTNSAKSGIIAVYVAPAGTLNMSDDLLGKQSAGAGRTVTLKANDPQATCVFDLQFLMSNGDAVDMKGVDLCRTDAVTYGG